MWVRRGHRTLQEPSAVRPCSCFPPLHSRQQQYPPQNHQCATSSAGKPQRKARAFVCGGTPSCQHAAQPPNRRTPGKACAPGCASGLVLAALVHAIRVKEQDVHACQQHPDHEHSLLVSVRSRDAPRGGCPRGQHRRVVAGIPRAAVRPLGREHPRSTAVLRRTSIRLPPSPQAAGAPVRFLGGWPAYPHEGLQMLHPSGRCKLRANAPCPVNTMGCAIRVHQVSVSASAQNADQLRQLSASMATLPRSMISPVMDRCAASSRRDRCRAI